VYNTKRCETGGREGSCLKGPRLTTAMGWNWILSIAIADGGLVTGVEQVVQFPINAVVLGVGICNAR
jgi:hypothetical protein